MSISMSLLFAALVASDGGTVPAPAHRASIPPSAFAVFKEDSGPVNYYSVGEEDGTPILRGAYRPGLGNVVLMARVPEAARQAVRSVSWRWRAHVLPKDANDCGPGASDSVASVFIAYKAGLKLMVIKYVWTEYSVDPRREFVKHYGGKLEDVPDFVAIGVMTDGDNSQSPAEADYADFVVEW